MNRPSSSREKSLLPILGLAGMALVLPGWFLSDAENQKAHAEQSRIQYCDERGNACNDREPSSTSGSLSRDSTPTEPDTPAEPEPEPEPEPTPG
jgi:hypothetical protein